ncbi:MAG: hypothetical protein ABSH20_31530, partial [Tepidisphaeraceae bacterium]
MLAHATTPTEELFPATTTGFLSIANVKQLSEHWDQTQLGKLAKDPLMKPFVDDLRHQFDRRWAGVEERLGVTIEDLRDVPTGEVGMATILPAPDDAVTAIVADVTGNQKGAKELLTRITAHMTKRGAKQSKRLVLGIELLVFDVPKMTTADGNDIAAHQTAYFLTDELFGAVDDLKIMIAMVPRLTKGDGAAGPAPAKEEAPATLQTPPKTGTPAKPQAAVAPAAGTLAEVAGFQAVIARAKADAVAAPQVHWYVQPLGYMESLRASTPERERRKGRSMIDSFKTQGFTALQAVGGYLDFATEGVELVHRTAVYAPGPFQKSMKMMVFPNHP